MIMSKKVLMVLDEEFPPDDRVYKEAQTLLLNGFQVSIACYTFKDRPHFEQVDGIKVYRKKIPGLIYKSSVAVLKLPVYFNWWKRYIKQTIKKETFDIIHIHDLPLSKVGAYFKKKFKLKLVIDLHENWPAHISRATHTNTFFGKLLSSKKQWVDYEKNILKNADRIITVVDEMKNRIAEAGHDSGKIIILENTIAPENFNAFEYKPDTRHFTLFFAGGLNIERGLQYVIPGLKYLIDEIPNIKLQIVGKGSYQNHLEKLVHENQLENYVDFLGWKPLQEVLELTAAANLTLIPHIKWEQTDCSSPNKLFQCMLQGVPLVVSNCNSVQRIVEQTNSGVSYTFDNMKEFAEKVLYLYKNPEIMKQMSVNGTLAVHDHYNWQNTSRNFIAEYKTLST